MARRTRATSPVVIATRLPFVYTSSIFPWHRAVIKGVEGIRARSRCYQTLPLDQDIKGATPGVDGGMAGEEGREVQRREFNSRGSARSTWE